MSKPDDEVVVIEDTPKAGEIPRLRKRINSFNKQEFTSSKQAFTFIYQWVKQDILSRTMFIYFLDHISWSGGGAVGRDNDEEEHF